MAVNLKSPLDVSIKQLAAKLRQQSRGIMTKAASTSLALALVLSATFTMNQPIAHADKHKQPESPTYSSGLTQTELDEMFGGFGTPRVNERAFTEGSMTMQWGNQKHLCVIRKNKLIHFWADIDRATHTQKMVNRGNLPGDDYVGTPVTVSEGDQQHFIGRTKTGQIRHYMWSSQTGLKASSFHLNTNTPKAGHDPAAAWMSEQLHLFYVDFEGTLQHKWTDNATNKWSHNDSWSRAVQAKVGKTKFTGKPSLFQWHNQQHVFVRTTDNRLAHFYWFPGASGIQFHFWTATPAASDPVTLATPDTQSIFYNDTNGHLQRLRWRAKENKTDTYNWSKAHNNKPFMAVGRPQVFEVYGQEHVVLRHIDGSVSHAFKNDFDPRPIHHETFGPGTTKTELAAARLFESQDIFAIDRDGNVKHRLWRPHAPAGQPNILKYDWGIVPTSDQKLLPANQFTQLRASRGPGRSLYLSTVWVTKQSAVHFAARVSKDEWTGGPQTEPELDYQPLRPFEGSFIGGAPIWKPDGTDQMHLTAVSDKGTAYSIQEPQNFGGRGAFEAKPLISAFGANGPIASAVASDAHARSTGHVMHTKHGITFAYIPQKTNDSRTPQRLKWSVLRYGQLANKNVSIAPAQGSFQVYFVDDDGRVVTGLANDEATPVPWKKLPALPGGKAVSGKVAVSSNTNGAQRVVAVDSEGHVFTLAQTVAAGNSGNPKWENQWTQISTTPTLGTPAIATLADGSMRAVTRSKDGKLLISQTNPNGVGGLSSLKVPNSPAGKQKLVSDLELVTFTKNQQFKFLVLGRKQDNSIFAVGAGQSGVRSAQASGEEVLHPAKLERKR